MILIDDNPTVIKRYIDRDFIGGPTVEASGVDPRAFHICIGGADYYAQEERLDRTQATQLRDLLTEWLESA